MAMVKVVVRLPPGLAGTARTAALAEGVSVSAWLRHLVQQEDHRRNGEGTVAITPPPWVIHRLMPDFSLACGEDGRGYSSGVLAEVTCEACKAVTDDLPSR